MAYLAVVIVSYNSERWLEPCLKTLYNHVGDIDVEVIVADNASTDGSAELVESRFPAARVIRCENKGFAYGNNRALMTTSAPFVLFLNPDTEILSGTFAELLDELGRRSEAGLIGVRAVSPDGSLNPTIRRFPTAVRIFFEAVGSERFPFRASWLGERELDPGAYDRETACDWVSGSFMLARREALLAAGFMDERFFLYCEEPDLCLRIKASGWQVRYLPSMTILHHAGWAGWNPRLAAQDAYARRQYMAKHFSRAHRMAGTAAMMLGLLIRFVFGSPEREERRARRRASLLALKTLVGLAPAPFGEPPLLAVAPPDDAELAVPTPSGR